MTASVVLFVLYLLLGTTTDLINYFYDDFNVYPETIYYYRLKQIDFNGDEKLSQIVAMRITNYFSGSLSISGNPVQQPTIISYHLYNDSHVLIALSDITGKQIRILKDADESEGMHFLTLDKSSLNLSKGIYFVTLSSLQQVATQKLIIE